MENKVLAIVDGREVKESDLHNLLRSIGQAAAQFQGEEGQKQLIDELVSQELFYSDAKATNLDQDPEYIAAVEDAKKNLLQQFALNKLLREVPVSEEELKSFFEENKNMFATGPKASAAHILVDSEEKIQEIQKEIAEGLDFAEAASKYSSCPSGQNGGDLGEFGPGQMVPEFDQAVFSMNEGEISEPVKTQFGYHLVKLNSRTDGAEPTFEESKEQVQQHAENAKRGKIYGDKVAELKGKYNVEIK